MIPSSVSSLQLACTMDPGRQMLWLVHWVSTSLVECLNCTPHFWSYPSHCGYLGNEQADGSTLRGYFSLLTSVFQINEYVFQTLSLVGTQHLLLNFNVIVVPYAQRGTVHSELLRMDREGFCGQVPGLGTRTLKKY